MYEGNMVLFWYTTSLLKYECNRNSENMSMASDFGKSIQLVTRLGKPSKTWSDASESPSNPQNETA